MSLWDVSTLLISSLQQSRYSSFYLDFRLQHLTSGTWELSSKPNNALHRHCFSWASSSVQSRTIPGCFHARSFVRTLVTGGGDFYVADSVPWTSSWKEKSSFSAPASLQVLLWNYSDHSPLGFKWPFFLSFSLCLSWNLLSCCCGHFARVCVHAGALWGSLGDIGFGALDVRVKAVKIRLSQSNWQGFIQAVQVQLLE